MTTRFKITENKPLLNMYIGRVFIDKYELSYTGMHTCTQRQQYQENIAAKLYQKNVGKIKQSCAVPEFFVEAQSDFYNANSRLTWSDLKMKYAVKMF